MNNKSFKTYIVESLKEYEFRLKFACAEFTKECVNELEEFLTKYGLKEMSDVKETVLQENPLDFPNVKNRKVFIIDVVLTYPCTPDMIITYLCNKWGMSRSEMVVYGKNDPRQAVTDEYLERVEREESGEYTPVTGSEYEEPKEKFDYSAEELKQEIKQKKISTTWEFLTNELVPEIAKSDTAEIQDDTQNNISVLGSKK